MAVPGPAIPELRNPAPNPNQKSSQARPSKGKKNKRIMYMLACEGHLTDPHAQLVQEYDKAVGQDEGDSSDEET